MEYIIMFTKKHLYSVLYFRTLNRFQRKIITYVHIKSLIFIFEYMIFFFFFNLSSFIDYNTKRFKLKLI